MTSRNFIKLTATERAEVRAALRLENLDVHISNDGKWFCDVLGHVFEAESPAALLHELADIAEGS